MAGISKKEHWYAEVSFEDNERFASFMVQHGGGNEQLRPNLEDVDGNLHDAWYLNGSGLTLRRVRELKKEIPSLHLFKKTGSQTLVSDVTFLIEKKKTKAKMVPAKKLMRF